MIISRTAFKLKFGQARTAIALWKDIMDAEVGNGPVPKPPMRLLSDLSGPNYTLVTELNMRSFADMEPDQHIWSTNYRIRELYPKFVPLCEESTTDLFHVEHQVGGGCPAGFIVERMTFQLKYGTARDAIANWKNVLNVIKDRPNAPDVRLLSDITGPSYTLVTELHYRNMMEFGPKMALWMSDAAIKEAYAPFVPLCERSMRTLYRMEHCV
jgi:hypothetical protein